MDSNELKRISNSYDNYNNQNIRQNTQYKRQLAEGKSSIVFLNDVVRRVKLEFMGVVNQRDQSSINYYQYVGKDKFSSEQIEIKDLIVSDNSLMAVSKLFSDLGSNKAPVISLHEDYMEYIEKIDLQEEVAEQLFAQSFSGRYVLKCITMDDRIYFETIIPENYFTVKNSVNTNINDYIIKYSVDEKENIHMEIYSDGKTEYRSFQQKGNDLVEVDCYLQGVDTGLKEDGLGFIDTYEGWQVIEVYNIYKASDYTDDIIASNRELVIGNTLNSQAFDKIANPLLQVPESLLEYDENGEAKVRLDDRTIVVRQGDAEVKQVALESKVNDWQAHKQALKEQIYSGTGTNENAFGLSNDGAAVSGESKRRSLERTLATIETKRSRVYRAIEKLIEFGIRKIKGASVEVRIQGKEIISLSISERLNIAAQAYNAEMMSLSEAIEYVNLTDVTTEEELEQVKKELPYKERSIRLLLEIQKQNRNDRIQEELNTQVDELLVEFGLTETEGE